MASTSPAEIELHEPEELLSFTGLSRKLDVNYVRMINTFRAAQIRPDFVNHEVQLFRMDRLPQLEKLFSK